MPKFCFRTLFLIFLGVFISSYASAQSLGYNDHRIAMSADGNMRSNTKPAADPDDWGATPAALAMLAKQGLQDKLVHFSYNNWMDFQSVDDWANQMKISAEGGRDRWGFKPEVFFDVTHTPDAAIQHLRDQIIVSSSSDPLYYIHMGPSEFFYRVVKRVVDQGYENSLNHVYVISHSGYNNDYKVQTNHHTLDDALAYAGNRIQYQKIQDQNAKNNPNRLWHSGTNFSVWHWMRDHSDINVRWMFERLQAHAHGQADISDAGMVFYLTVGDEFGSPEKFRNFIGSGIPTNGQPGEERDKIPGRVEAENYDRFFDTTNGNSGNQYRSDNVDIERTTDNNGGYNVGWIAGNEWLEYDINVVNGGEYSGLVRVASRDGNGMFTLEIDGVTVGEAYTVDATGGYQNWATLNSRLGNISEGEHTLRVQVQNGGFNINWIELSLNNPSPTPTPTSTPTPVPTPDPIEDQCDNTQQCRNIFGFQATDCANSASAQSVCMCGTSRCDALTTPVPTPVPTIAPTPTPAPIVDQCNTTAQCKNIFGSQATDCKNSASDQSICMCGSSPCDSSVLPTAAPTPLPTPVPTQAPIIDQCNSTAECKNIFGSQATDCKNSASDQSICMCGSSSCDASPVVTPAPLPSPEPTVPPLPGVEPSLTMSAVPSEWQDVSGGGFQYLGNNRYGAPSSNAGSYIITLHNLPAGAEAKLNIIGQRYVSADLRDDEGNDSWYSVNGGTPTKGYNTGHRPSEPFPVNFEHHGEHFGPTAVVGDNGQITIRTWPRSHGHINYPSRITVVINGKTISF